MTPEPPSKIPELEMERDIVVLEKKVKNLENALEAQRMRWKQHENEVITEREASCHEQIGALKLLVDAHFNEKQKTQETIAKLKTALDEFWLDEHMGGYCTSSICPSLEYHIRDNWKEFDEQKI